MRTLRIQALNVGKLVGFPRAALTYQRGYSEMAEVTQIMFLITGGEHAVIVDTGTGTIEETKERHGFTLVRPADQEPLAVLAAAGIDPADVRTVVNTHLHWDHSSNNHLFPNAQIYVQKTELAYAVDPFDPNKFSYERHSGMEPMWVKAIGRTQTVDGDHDLLPGIRLVHLPGHTPGSQGVLVETGSGRYLIAGDCVTCYENWEGDERCAHIPAGAFTDLGAYMSSFDKIEGLDCIVIPSHDPEVVRRGVFE